MGAIKMKTNKEIIKRIKEVWKEQEELLVKTHKKIFKKIKDFSYEDLKEILSDEEIELYQMEEEEEGVFVEGK
jgi:predicted transcriptional regulator